MNSKEFDKLLLKILFTVNLISILPILFRKPPIKDWLFVYFFNAATNGVLDNILVKLKMVKYPVRLLPRYFHIHVLFDYFLYPSFTVLFNQFTMKDKPFTILIKLIFLIVPLYLIEFLAEKKTRLVKWSRNWKWHYSISSLLIKSTLTRTMIGVIRSISKKQGRTE
ncbi:CBO0543 family protein [Heyndrickxia acidiproducens]|uniref:CBO0543 family protein n=1 Tax=Heyndrickxia acidiproducens TaxID=1121084 RepID=UPI00036F2DD3|nr:CBO0543 family protein [Heyndrickxia acidiproducens]